MSSRLTVASFASAVLAVMSGAALANTTPTMDGRLAPPVHWFAQHPAEFRTFLKAVHEGNAVETSSLARMAGLYTTDLKTMVDGLSEVTQVKTTHSHHVANYGRRPVTRRM